MAAHKPHFLLFSETSPANDRAQRMGVPLEMGLPRWRFVLESLAGGERVVAEHSEPDSDLSRLELLAVVRGLEALDGPSQVTLVTRSRYVTRGIRRGLPQWRAHDWRWERFGRWVPIRDYDLWQRIDGALRFHEVDCRVWRFDEAGPEERLPEPHFALSASDTVIDEEAVVIVPKAHRRPPPAARRWRTVTGLPQRLVAAVAGTIQLALDPGFARA